MRKQFILLALIIGIFSFSEKKVNIVYKAELENEGKFKSIKKSKIKYTPLDLTVSSLNNEYKANIVFKGYRRDLSFPTLASRYITNFEDNKKIDYREEKKIDFFGDETIVKYFNDEEYRQYNDEYVDNRFPKYDVLESSIFKDENQTEIHSHDHEHEHSHNHTHDEGEHNHNELIGETLNIEAPQRKRNIKENKDFEVKVSLEVNKKNYGLKYSKYLTSFDEGENRYQKNDGIIEGRVTGVIKDKFAINIMPRMVTREFKPAILETNTYLKYKINDDTFIGLNMYNGGQVNLINERNVYKNKVEVYFDYNTERKRYHKFWEVVDHEHDKLDQFKFKFTYDDKHNKKYSPLNKEIIDNYKMDKKYNLNLVLKKSDFLIKGLSISNNFDFNTSFSTEIDSNRRYGLIHRFYFKKYIDSTKIFGTTEGELLLNPSYEKELASYTIKEKDRFKTIKHLRYEIDENPIEYFRVTESISRETKLTDYTKVISKKYDINNLTELEYIKKNDKINLSNKINYKNQPFNNEYKLEDDITLSYERRFKHGIKLKFDLNNKYEKYSFKNITMYQVDKLKAGFDFNYTYNENGMFIKGGLDMNASLITRKAHVSMLYGPKIHPLIREQLAPNDPYLKQVENEKDKWVFGQEYTFKPYVNLKYSPISNLDLKLDFEMQKIYIKNPLRRLYGSYNPVDTEVSGLPMEYKLKFGLQYKY